MSIHLEVAKFRDNPFLKNNRPAARAWLFLLLRPARVSVSKNKCRMFSIKTRDSMIPSKFGEWLRQRHLSVSYYYLLWIDMWRDDRGFGCGFFVRETMRSIDNSFYQSIAWKRVRAAYIEQHRLCERCLKQGRYTPSKFVHHIVYLTPENVQDASIAYGFDNLEALCADCHNEEHFGTSERRFRVDNDGNIIPK